MNLYQHMPCVPSLNRRHFLQRAACGFGGVALHAMLADVAAAADNPLAPRTPHFVPRAKRVIFLFMAGGPSQHDLFVPKPRLVRDHGKRVGLTDLPRGIPVGTEKFLTLGPVAPIAPRGQSGAMISNLLPHLSGVADDLCFLHGMQVDNPAHDLATLQFNTGVFNEVRPSMGAWASYGLGTENENIPGFISIHADSDVRAYGSAFLPAAHQGTVIGQIPQNAKESAIRFLNDPQTTEDAQRRQIDFVQAANRRLLDRVGEDRVMEGVIDSFELAFRMQAETPKLVDLSTEASETLSLYGVGDKGHRQKWPSMPVGTPIVRGGSAIRAGDNRRVGPSRRHSRRLAQIVRRGRPAHRSIDCRSETPRTAGPIRWSSGRASSAARLGARTFPGRAPLEKHGREHQPDSFTAFLAGGGVRGGFSHGETDEFGYKVTRGRVHIHDLHATILHLLGLDHERLTYRHAGRDYRLTDVYGNVVHEILA